MGRTLVDSLVQMDGSREEFIKNLQAKYSRLARQGKIFKIQQLIRQTGIEPKLSDDEFNTLYLASAKGSTHSSSRNIRDVQKWDKDAHESETAVFNALGDEFYDAVQKGYACSIQDGRVEREDFQNLKGLTGIAITEETVQKAINARLEKTVPGGNWWFKNVEKATGIKPVPDPNLVQEIYSKNLEEAQQGDKKLFLWERLVNSTGIKPREETVQAAYKMLTENSRIYDLLEFIELTEIKPGEETVQEAYASLVRQQSFSDHVHRMQKLTGVKPREGIVQEAYSQVVDLGKTSWDYNFRKIFESTGIQPPEETVQKAYLNCIRKGYFEDYEQLHDVFKVEPSAEVSKALTKYLSS